MNVWEKIRVSVVLLVFFACWLSATDATSTLEPEFIGRSNSYMGLRLYLTPCISNVLSGMTTVELRLSNANETIVILPRVWAMDTWNRTSLTRQIWTHNGISVEKGWGDTSKWPDCLTVTFLKPIIGVSERTRKEMGILEARAERVIFKLDIGPSDIRENGLHTLRFMVTFPLTDWTPDGIWSDEQGKNIVDIWNEERDGQTVVIYSNPVTIEKKGEMVRSYSSDKAAIQSQR